MNFLIKRFLSIPFCWEGGPDFEPYAVPHLFTFYQQTNEALQATQNFAYDPVEKYRHWENYDDVTNHHIFEITPDFNELTARLDRTYETITIENSFVSAPGANPENDVIDFKDPWLIDYPDPLYGNNKRNRGMSAPFKSRPSPFNPDSTTPYDGDVYQ